MHRLQAVFQHGAVDFTQHILSDFYDVIRPYAEDAAIESAVVDLAQ